MLKISLAFWKSEPHYAYILYVYKRHGAFPFIVIIIFFDLGNSRKLNSSSWSQKLQITQWGLRLVP